MSDRPIGYYVHHHGAGHRARADTIMAASDQTIVLLGTGIGDAGIDLADDCHTSGQFDGKDGAPSRPEALHYAPIDHAGIRTRVAKITAWIEYARPKLMVVDVSVEVAMLARIASVPTIYVRLGGERVDPAHLDAFRGAVGILAPFHRYCEVDCTADWVREKSFYAPGLTDAPARHTPVKNRILVVFGRGGEIGNGKKIAEAARSCPGWSWRVIGPAAPPSDMPANLEFVGWTATPEAEIASAAVVIGAAGNGLVSAVMAADRPFVCIPEDRPFREQHANASGLDLASAAIVLSEWPRGIFWNRILDDAVALPGTGRRMLHDCEAAKKTAQWLASHSICQSPSLKP